MDAKDIIEPVKNVAKDLKNKVMGTPEQNAKASAEMKAQDAKSPDTAQAKVNKVLGYKKGGFVEHDQQVKKHSAGFKHHNDHVKAMCGGGYTGKKAK
jgi:hypothetical protein